MQAKSFEHRALVMRAIDEGRTPQQIQGRLNVHPNTVRKYHKQSLAMLPSEGEVDVCCMLLNIPRNAVDFRETRIRISSAQLRALVTEGATAVSLTPETKHNVVHGQRRTNLAEGQGRQGDAVFFRLNKCYDCGEHLSGYWIESQDSKLVSATQCLLQSCVEAGLPVPQASSGGGLVEKTRKMTDQNKVHLAQVLNATQLSLEQAAEYIRVHVDDTFPQVSVATLSKVAKEMGLMRRGLSVYDPKAIADAARQLEMEHFLTEIDKASEGVLHGENLIFMDESNFHLNMDEMRGYRGYTFALGGDSKVPVPMTKGRTTYVELTVAVGLMFFPEGGDPSKIKYVGRFDQDVRTGAAAAWEGLLRTNGGYAGGPGGVHIGYWSLQSDEHIGPLMLYWELSPPARKPALPFRYDFDEPLTEEEAVVAQHTAVPLGPDGWTDARRRDVQRALTALGVDYRVITSTPMPDGSEEERPEVNTSVDDAELLRLLNLSKLGERKGLPRKFIGTRNKGGSRQSALGTTSGFMRFVRHTATHVGACFGTKTLSDSRIYLDNASTHGAVRVDNDALSFMHQYAADLGFKGAVFGPVRQPRWNVAEQVFAFAKQYLRSIEMPPAGHFSEAAIMTHIQDALMNMTPSMVAAWIISRGYTFSTDDVPCGMYMTRIETPHGPVYVNQKAATVDGVMMPGDRLAPGVRLAYCKQARNVELGDNINKEISDLNTRLKRLRQQLAELLHPRPRVAQGAAPGEGQVAQARAVFAELRNELRGPDDSGLRETYLSTITKALSAEGGEPTFQPPGDVFKFAVMAIAVMKHWSNSINRAKHGQDPRRKLCALSIASACTETTAASLYDMGNHSDVVAMNDRGQIAGTSHAVGALDRMGRPRVTWSSPVIDFGPVHSKTTVRMEDWGSLDVWIKDLAARIMRGEQIDAAPGVGPAVAQAASPLLTDVLTTLTKFLKTGGLRRKPPPCKIVGHLNGRLRIIVRDWNEWRVVRDADHPALGQGRPLGDAEPLVLVEHVHPEYIAADGMTEDAFADANAWGKMTIRVIRGGEPELPGRQGTPVRQATAATAQMLMVYKHVGFDHDFVDKLKNIVVRCIAKELSKAIPFAAWGGDRAGLATPKDQVNAMLQQEFDAKMTLVKSNSSHSLHRLSARAPPLWAIHLCKDRIESVANALTLHADDPERQGGPIRLAQTAGQRAAAHLPRNVRESVWIPFVDRLHEADVRFIEPGDADGQKRNLRRLTRLMLNLRLSPEMLAKMEVLHRITEQVQLSIFDYNSAQAFLRTQGDLMSATRDGQVKNRYPGYPVVPYGELLRHLRDAALQPPIAAPAAGEAAQPDNLSLIRRINAACTRMTASAPIPFEKANVYVMKPPEGNRGLQQKFMLRPGLQPANRDAWNELLDVGATEGAQVAWAGFLLTSIRDVWNTDEGAPSRDALEDILRRTIIRHGDIDTKVQELRDEANTAVRRRRTAIEEQIQVMMNNAENVVRALTGQVLDLLSRPPPPPASDDWVNNSWVLLIQPRAGVYGVEVQTTREFHLMPPLEHQIEPQLRMGMPWEDVLRTAANVKSVPEEFSLPVRAYSIAEMQSMHDLPPVSADEAVSDGWVVAGHVIKESYQQQITTFIGRSQAAADGALLRQLRRALVATEGLDQDPVNYIRKVQAVFDNQRFSLHPTVEDMSDYYILETHDPANNARIIYQFVHASEVTDEFVLALLVVCDRRNAQRLKRTLAITRRR